MTPALLAVTLAAAVLAQAAPVAEPITEANAAERIFGGPDAIGGVGDWYLANDLVQVIVDDPSRRHAKLNHGGTIVDAGVRGRRGDDQFAQLFPILNLDQRVILGYDTIRAEVDPDGRAARLVVSGRAGLHSISRDRWLDPLVPETDQIAQVFPETVYEVRPGEPFVRITTRLENRGSDAAPIFSFGEVWMRGGRSLRSFSGHTRAPDRSRGFHHRGFDREAILAAGDAMADFTFVAMAGLRGWPPIAYALAAPERAAAGLVSFGVTSEHVSLVNAFLQDPGWASVGLWRILLATRGELPAGATWTYERRLYVTPGADVAASTDLLFPALGLTDGTSGVAGRVEPPDSVASIHVEAREGWPITQIVPAPDGPAAGAFRAVLPPGDYVLTVHAPHRPPQRLEVTVPPGAFAEVPAIAFPATGRLRFSPAFADGGPGRVIVEGIDGTEDPAFGAELLGFEVDGHPVASGTETRELLFAGRAGDPEQVEVAPGRYRLTATRGPEFGIASVDVEVPEPGAVVEVPLLALERVTELPGWLSADLHVHAEASDDSGMSNQARLASYVAEGVDVMVTTDHDHLGRFEPALDTLGVRDAIHVVQGVEVTSSAPSRAAPWTLGHNNAWPVPYRETAHRRGAPPSQELTLADLYALLRAEYGARVVQLNHALSNDDDKDGAFLSHLGSVGEPFDPALPLEAEPNRALLEPGADGRTRGIDFDAMEVMNGAKFRQYQRLREAWYALLRQGVRRTATGNSDTHGPDEVAGYPRNYVALAGPWSGEAFDAAIREGRSFATTGPLIRVFRVNGAGIGDTVAAPGGRIAVEIQVAAAPWVPVDEVRVLVGGEVAQAFRNLPAVAPDGTRLAARVDLTLPQDAFVTLEAGVPLDADPDRWIAEHAGDYARIAPDFVPQAISNPIWVDVDGDGAAAPTGLPTASPDRLGRIALAVLALASLWWWLRQRVLAPRRRG